MIVSRKQGMKQYKNQLGFSIIEVLFIVLVVAGIIAAGLAVYQQLKSTNTRYNSTASTVHTTHAQPSVTSSVDTSRWSTNTFNDITFKIPAKWTFGILASAKPTQQGTVYTDISKGDKNSSPCAGTTTCQILIQLTMYGGIDTSKGLRASVRNLSSDPKAFDSLNWQNVTISVIAAMRNRDSSDRILSDTVYLIAKGHLYQIDVSLFNPPFNSHDLNAFEPDFNGFLSTISMY
jgi:Tfp pilus assembly protein PilV